MARAKPSRALGVQVTLRCPRCGHTYQTTTSAGTGLKPGQVIDQEHLPGFCIPAGGNRDKEQQ